MRPTWKGSISFGLVYIPISVYPATREEKRAHEAASAPLPMTGSSGAKSASDATRALTSATLAGYQERVAMTNRKGHTPTAESNEQLVLFFEYFLKHGESTSAR